MFRFHVGRPLLREPRRGAAGLARRAAGRSLGPRPRARARIPAKVRRSLAELARVSVRAAAARHHAELGRLHRRHARLRSRARRGARGRGPRARHRLQRPRLRDGAHRGPPRRRAGRRRQALARPRRASGSRASPRARSAGPATSCDRSPPAPGYAIALDVGRHVHRRHAARCTRPAAGSGSPRRRRRPTTRRPGSSPASTRRWRLAGVDAADVRQRPARHDDRPPTRSSRARARATALLTTAGFKYVLEIGRQDVPRRASMFAWVKPKRPVPPERIFEIGGRIGPRRRRSCSRSTRPPCAPRRARIAQPGVGSVAVVLLHSYANAGARAARRGRCSPRSIPGALVSLSSEVLPVFREYER